MKYEVSVEGTFVTETVVEAKTEEEAVKKATEIVKKRIGLSDEDYTVDTISTIAEVV